ncbi:MAG: hypothetical protein AB7P69_24500 [Candidatus Binatia bacterium]
MDMSVFSSQELPLALRVLTTVAANPEALTERERQFLQVVNALHQGGNEVGVWSPIDTPQVAHVITNPHHRKRLLQMAIVMAMVEDNITARQQQTLQSLASGLSVNERGLRVLHEAASGHRFLARLDMTRRMIGNMVEPVCREEGIAGVKKIMEPLFFKKGGEDPALAWRFRQLGLLPQDTLGQAFWEHCTQRQFGFPGEPGAIPLRLVFHDFGHVLAGYDTTPAGEIQQGAFQAGFVRNDGFLFLLFVFLHFHWGVKVTPIADADKGLFDIPLVMHALQRGAACTVDLSDHWDFWQVVELPLEEVRTRYGISSISPSATEQRAMSIT